ncbi:protein LTO1 homolog [Dendronephthya gigantea]|uniref:protein LTO1 homolog n=1 Tax=Dendronephthya gigantea TaxID=151771 RepID=UPI001069D11D|nr:protein LTO1 homolog [Dendronephthya gigantea]
MSSFQDDLFDSVVFLEENCQKQGFNDGFIEGEVKGWKQGYETGLLQGKQVGNEIGFYKGFVQTWLALYKNEGSKVQVKLEGLFKLLDQDWSDTARDLIPELEHVRAKFKQICSMLNLNIKHTTKDVDKKQLSF